MDLSLAQVLLVVLVCLVGLVVGGLATLYFSFKGFVTLAMEKAIPEEAVDRAVLDINGVWKKWLAKTALSLVRSRLIEWVFRLITAPNQIAGIIIRLVFGLVLITIVALLNIATWYFADVAILVVTGATLFGALCGWFFISSTVDKLLNAIIKLATGYSTAAITGISGAVGKRLTS